MSRCKHENKRFVTDGKYTFEVCEDCNRFRPAISGARWRTIPAPVVALAVVDPRQETMPYE